MKIFRDKPAAAPKAADDKKTFKEQVGALKNLPKFFRLIWETSPSITIGNMLLRLVKSALPLSMLYIGKLIIDEVIRLIAVTGERDLSYLWMLVAAELGLAIVSDLISRGITLLDSLLGDLFSNKTSVTLIEHAATLDLTQFEDATFYDKLERARRQTVTRVVLMSQVLSQVQDIVTIGFLAVGLIAFNPWLILILLIAVIPSFLGETHFNERTYSLSRSWTPERRELDYLRYIGASDETAKEIKTFNLSGFLAERFKLLSDKYYLLNKSLIVKRAVWGIALSALGTLAYYGAYIFILMQTVAGIITVGSLTFLAGSFNSMRGLLQGIMTRFSQIAESALYLQDLFDFLELKPQITPPVNPVPVPRPIQHGFTFENVGFKYQNSERWAVRNLSFHLRAGEKLALVGENGAGKTTLVKLLARLYEPTEGRIMLDGVDLREYDLNDLRHQVGIIFQDYVRFQMSASDNIAIGQISNIRDKDRIQGSAQKSLADPVIQRLPDKYDQVLGKRFNKGVELSGGEWQKVALARAYMRDAQLLILDEPTSALDARAEHEVFIRFSELIEGKTAVLISHRFSTVRMADRILFLEQGQLKELGSHEELLAQNGKYAELFKLQAKGYQ
ncbi:ABC transporter ATP-binding protein [Pontibacter sp. BT310]|uniref:ABC transporter ATP-binding protein/permease n=1 Tax=Pontibacter populi TaxID=890055 RepID=A0ABS6XBA3_9BACT|nr:MULTISPECIES: ABC transporter ATP-binding protein [Pontibacter]MBJ6117608.1 ABC transporter ATP-binding protein [Pontibacter sp. BT310]MBR0570033.1 ABC transporter ATP-binding protein [Microvirga sp. STS03]MBW3364460.1 ABC transporter ATP-binding protein/permease [Pontibacter populi]